jgi:Bacterial lectin
MQFNLNPSFRAFGGSTNSATQDSQPRNHQSRRRASRILCGCVAILAFAVQAQTIDHSTGFANSSDLTTNGSVSFVGPVLRLTSGRPQAGSVFSNSKVCIKSFTTTFPFMIAPLTNPPADGFTFTMQGDSPTALGGNGGELGYYGILNSLAVRFDYGYNNYGEGLNATGLFHTGAALTSFAWQNVDLSASGIDLRNTNPKSATLSYDGTALTETITDLTANKSFSHTYTIDIPSFTGGNTAYVGFTGGTYLYAADQDIESWTFQNPPPTISGVSVDKSMLWPPDHKMVDVTVNYGANDPCSAPVCSLTISDNEPVNGTGDGNTSPDWVVVDAHHVQLRTERNGNGQDRVYTITISCKDNAGNVASSTATVTVPHDRGND